MKKTELTLTFEEEQLDALEFYLKKANTTAHRKMTEALKALYEQTVPEAVREYLDSKNAPAVRTKRPPKPPQTKMEPKSITNESQEEYHEQS